MSKRRALLDTNVWRYVVDGGQQGRLLDVARRGRWDIQIAPAVLFETFRMRNVALRSALVRLMVDHRFKRLMPEAYSESMEILGEVRRLHPKWLRSSPDLRFFKRLEKDWSRRMGGFWVRCEKTPNREAEVIAGMEGDLVDRGRKQAEEARREMAAANWKKAPPFNTMLATPSGPMRGWRGKPVDAWRLDSLAGTTFALRESGNVYRDWLGPFMELDDGLLDSSRWVAFWLYEATADALPRQWLRAAHAFALRFRKVTDGATCDTQLFTYLLDTDLLVTADKALVQILGECIPYAPCRLPAGRLIAGGPAGVEDMLEHFSADDVIGGGEVQPTTEKVLMPR